MFGRKKQHGVALRVIEFPVQQAQGLSSYTTILIDGEEELFAINKAAVARLLHPSTRYVRVENNDGVFVGIFDVKTGEKMSCEGLRSVLYG